MRPERLVDAHHHLWDLRRGRYPWLQDGPPVEEDTSDLAPIRRDYLPSEYRADTAGVPVVGSVHVEAAADPEHPAAETRRLAELRDRTGLPSAIVAFARLERPDLDEVLTAHLQTPAVRGIRQMLNWEPAEQVAERAGILDDPRWAEGLGALGDRGLSFDLQVFPSQLRRAAEVLAEHSGTDVVLNHGGFVQAGTPERWHLWAEGVRAIAQLPNVAVKVSSYVSVDPAVDRPGWRDGLQRFVDTLADAFGPQRMMFGSNLPVDSRFASFGALLDAVVHATRHWTEADRVALFADVASRVYRLGEPDRTEGPR